jgi:hypothetical protein
MAQASAGGHAVGFGATERRDRWWIGPVFTATALSAWLLYYFVVAWQGAYYSAGPYLSPFYPSYVHAANPADTSPTNAFFGYGPTWWPWFITPALFLGFLPGVFRLSCYYYRKAYYRAFVGMPPACAVGPRRTDYRGETGLLVIQNLHRYTLYIAIALLPILFFEAFRSFSWKGQPGVGVGSVLLMTNCILLTGYTFGCHAWRHLIGGRLDCFSCDGLSQSRHSAWSWSTWLNARHQEFAWSSLVAIFAADAYIRLFAHGWIPDLNTWHGLSWVTEFVH